MKDVECNLRIDGAREEILGANTVKRPTVSETRKF